MLFCMDFDKIARRWQRKWRTARVFEANANERKKFFLTIPYPYVNAYPHLGHMYTFVRGDAFARFKRMQGYNVLFPQAFHATGSPIYAAARRVEENEQKQIATLKLMGFSDEEIKDFSDPKQWIKVFSKAWEEDLTALGSSIDWRRTFITTDLNPRYSKFIQWQFRTLKNAGLIEKGSHPVVWSQKLGLPVGDHDRSEGEGETPSEMLLIKFLYDDLVFPAATFRPETTFGVTNIWINPDTNYNITLVDNEKWVLVEECVEKLRLQNREVKVLEIIPGKDFIGKVLKNPVTEESVPILPASFVSSDTGTGVVMCVPAHAPFDYAALMDIKSSPEEFNVGAETIQGIEPIGLISVEGYSKWPAVDAVKKRNISSQAQKKELDDATHEIYKKEYHTGRLNEKTGKYQGLSIEEAKGKIIDDFKKEKKADSMWELINPVISRALDHCVVKIVENQWFMKYSEEEWKQKTKKCLSEVKLYPEKIRAQFDYVIDWLNDWACTREYGLGTKLPWDEKWVIESLSDSTIYMSFYTITHLLKKVTLGKINDKLFDYVMLGKGSKEDIDVDPELLDEMKSEFSYWYPVDWRNSGKDLVQNHLAFFMFNHVAIFPEKFWPRGIGVNGYVSVQKEKMSKSKGNFKTLREINKEFHADPARITMLSSGEELNDVDWDPGTAVTIKNKLEAFYDFSLANYNRLENTEMKGIDKWMEHHLNLCVKDTTNAMNETLFRTAIQRGFFDLQRHLKWYLKRTNCPNRKVINALIIAQTKMLAPFCPHFSEELWEKLGMEGFISLAGWPEFDESKINFSIENSEQLISNVLDDFNQVKKLAKLDNPKNLKIIVADDWKFELSKEIKQHIRGSFNPSHVMKAVIPKFSEHGKVASQLVQKFVRDPSKIPSADSSADVEFQFLKDAVEFLQEQICCNVEVVTESGSSEDKANSALPGKPSMILN